jgi:hypothetical protein
MERSPSSGTVGSSFPHSIPCLDRLCGLVVRVPGYGSEGPETDSRALQEKKVLGLERGPRSLVSTTEEEI